MPETKTPADWRWSAENTALVGPEGWNIFNDDEIQRDDEMSIFESDDDAIAFVTRKAAEGSAPHRLALEIHEEGEKARAAARG